METEPSHGVVFPQDGSPDLQASAQKAASVTCLPAQASGLGPCHRSQQERQPRGPHEWTLPHPRPPRRSPGGLSSPPSLIKRGGSFGPRTCPTHWSRMHLALLKEPPAKNSMTAHAWQGRPHQTQRTKRGGYSQAQPMQLRASHSFLFGGTGRGRWVGWKSTGWGRGWKPVLQAKAGGKWWRRQGGLGQRAGPPPPTETKLLWAAACWRPGDSPVTLCEVWQATLLLAKDWVASQWLFQPGDQTKP